MSDGLFTKTLMEFTRRAYCDDGFAHCWRDQIIAWHKLHITNGPTESMNNLATRVKRVAFGFRSFTNYRIRALLCAGKPNWDLLATITPR